MNNILFMLLIFTIIITSCSQDELIVSEDTDLTLPKLSIANVKVPENIKDYQVSAYLNMKATEKVVFEYIFKPVTATESVDYIPAENKRTIYPNQERIDIGFTIKEDREKEDLETFEIVVFNVVGATLVDSIGLIRIEDND